jgi:hypothetical protein
MRRELVNARATPSVRRSRRVRGLRAREPATQILNVNRDHRQLVIGGVIAVAAIAIAGLVVIVSYYALAPGRVSPLTRLRRDPGYSNVPTGGIVVTEDSFCDSGQFSASRILHASTAPQALRAHYEEGLLRTGWTELGAGHHRYGRVLHGQSYVLEVGAPNERANVDITVSREPQAHSDC